MTSLCWFALGGIMSSFVRNLWSAGGDSGRPEISDEPRNRGRQSQANEGLPYDESLGNTWSRAGRLVVWVFKPVVSAPLRSSNTALIRWRCLTPARTELATIDELGLYFQASDRSENEIVWFLKSGRFGDRESSMSWV